MAFERESAVAGVVEGTAFRRRHSLVVRCMAVEVVVVLLAEEEDELC